MRTSRHRITKPRPATMIGWTVTIEQFYTGDPEAVPSHPSHYDRWEIGGHVWGLTQRRATQRAQRRVAESNREWAEWERLRSEPRIELDDNGLPDMRGVVE